MKAVVTTGNGGYETLEYRDVPVPSPGPGEVLVAVLAAGVNNTDINTRLGWYSSRVTRGTEELTQTRKETDSAKAEADGGWSGATPFPLIQGTDCCGRVVEAADDADRKLVGLRVLIRPCMRIPSANGTRTQDSTEHQWMASDFDGAFAQYVKVPASEVFPVDCNWTDAELGTIPCAYGTAENMLHRAKVAAGDHLLVTGASGGVGSAVVQLAKRRGARVTAIAGASKCDAVKAIGAHRVLARGEDILTALGENTVDIVVDNVAGEGFGNMLKLLKPGSKMVSSGAIAGPVVALDMRDLYLKDITLFGCTAWDKPVFPNLISYIENGEITPVLAQSFALKDITCAQKAFAAKTHVGKLVLIPPGPDTLEVDMR
ncbi:MAG TPA: alcohol dehydrogenase [Desulfobacteraceae bacterium]|nr:alcohol dehydrogenase [Desulfobacteraceae bacterium]